MTSASDDDLAPPERADAPAASAETLQADLAAIEDRLLQGTFAVSLDDQLATLRRVALRILGPDDV